MNLRPTLASVPPVLGQLQPALGLSGVTASLLTALPLLCFGLLAPLASTLALRIGPETTVTSCLLLLATGLLLRSGPSAGTLFLGTILAGAAIAVCNVVLPALVKHYFPHRVGLLTGLSTMVMNSGAALAAGVTLPLQHAIGHGWRPALAVWALPVVAALAVWAPLMRRQTSLGADGGHGGRGGTARPGGSFRLLRNGLAWQVTAFMGLQSLAFYVLLTWLPRIYQTAGLDPVYAGVLLSLVMLIGIPSALLTPVLATRRESQSAHIVVITGLVLAGVLGLLIAPAAAGGIVWAVLLGIGQAGSFALALSCMALRARNSVIAAELSGMAQSLGYLLAASGPLIFGVIHDLAGGWRLSLIFLAAMIVPMILAGAGAGRDRQVA